MLTLLNYECYSLNSTNNSMMTDSHHCLQRPSFQGLHLLTMLCMQALLDDKTFCGLPLDEDNQDDLSAGRIKKWVAQISKEMK